MSSPAAEACAVLFSGGQDSTTCLFWAQREFGQVHALIFDYGQRHRVEIEQAGHIAHLAGVPAHVIPINSFAHLAPSSLTDAAPAAVGAHSGPGLPATFVPGRNLIFLSLAAAWAYGQGVHHLVSGMGEADYSGYPDCRADFATAAERAMALALDAPLRLHTPLMALDKAAIWRLADVLGVRALVEEHSHTCYNGNRSLRHAWGYGCGHCDACRLRAQGHQKAFGL